jgi:peptidoglycan/LPS O-acetylase OafA/YrhL
MPWRFKRRIYLAVLGAVALALAVIVLIQNQSLSTELLASLGVVGAAAILIVSLPTNGNGNDH